MKPIITSFLLVATFAAKAQFFYFPIPTEKKLYEDYEKAGIKVCYEYKTDTYGKSLTTVVDYAAKGMPVVLYEKGTNDAGDSITTSETSYKYASLRLQSATTKSIEYGESTVYYTYDAKGLLIKKEVSSIDPPTYKYVYDAKGKLLKATVSIKLPAVNADGEPTGKTINKLQSRIEFKCDAKGRVTEEKSFSVDAEDKTKPAYIIQWKYNDKNQVIQVININAAAENHITQDMEYDSKGFLKKRTVVEKDAETIVYDYEYCSDCTPYYLR